MAKRAKLSRKFKQRAFLDRQIMPNQRRAIAHGLPPFVFSKYLHDVYPVQYMHAGIVSMGRDFGLEPHECFELANAPQDGPPKREGDSVKQSQSDSAAGQ